MLQTLWFLIVCGCLVVFAVLVILTMLGPLIIANADSIRDQASKEEEALQKAGPRRLTSDQLEELRLLHHKCTWPEQFAFISRMRFRRAVVKNASLLVEAAFYSVEDAKNGSKPSL